MLFESHFLILLHECNVFSKLYLEVKLEVKAKTFRHKSKFSQARMANLFFFSFVQFTHVRAKNRFLYY